MHAGHVQQRRHSRPGPPGHDAQPLGHQRTVEAHERHDITHRRQRHQVQQVPQIRLRPGAEPAGPAQRTHQRDTRQECDPGRTQARKARCAIQPVWIDGRPDRRGRPLGHMVIQHQYVGLPRHGRERHRRRGAAIRAHDQRGPGGYKPQQRRAVGAITLGNAVGDVMQHGAAQAAQHSHQDGRAARAVYVIIAKHRHRLRPAHGMGQPVGRHIHVHQHGRVRHQRT